MAYTRRTWTNGEVIDAEKLNNIEEGISEAKNLANGKVDSSHNHSASDITSGTLPVDRGGTGASTAAGARTNLGIPNPTTSDKGRFLRVNSSGAYVLETVTAAEGVSF